MDTTVLPGAQPRRRITLRLVGAVVLVLLLVGLATFFTGVPAPGPLRRYSLAELEATRDKINDLDAKYAPCRRGPYAHIDWLHSRVVAQFTYPGELKPSEKAMVESRFLGLGCDYSN